MNRMKLPIGAAVKPGFAGDRSRVPIGTRSLSRSKPRFTAAPIAAAVIVCGVFGLSTSADSGTPERNANKEKDLPSQTDFSTKIKKLETQITELRKERARYAWTALGVSEWTERLRILSRHNCGFIEQDTKELSEQLRRYHLKIERTSSTLHSYQTEFAELHKAPDDGMLLITVHGRWNSEITLRERPANESEIGAITVTDSGKALVKLLSRTKADANAPKQLRILVMPEAPFGGKARESLKACVAAGYKTVTFTGYVVSGRFSSELKRDEYGNAPGFKWYEEVVKDPAELLKEIDEGVAKILEAR